MINSHNFSKNSHELLAKRLLEYSRPEEFGILEHRDRSDLVSVANDIGIEVTRAMFPGDGEAQGMLERFKGKRLEDVKPSALQLMKQKGYKFFVHNGRIGGYMPSEGMWVSLKPLEQIYTRKTEKLKDYPQHKENDLFIFSPAFHYYESNDLIEFTHWMRSQNADKSFVYNRVFVFDEPVLYMCTASIMSMKQYPFPQNVLNQLCQEVLELSK